ncbi:MAG: metalloregulator ArsR/SmtB family transcription factor [Holophaga sp.]
MKRLLPEPTISEVSRLFLALGEEPRLRILRALLEAGEPMPQKALAEACGLSQANASKHLIQLVNAGLVTREPRGNLVLFRPVLPLVTEVCDLVCTFVARRITCTYQAIV